MDVLYYGRDFKFTKTHRLELVDGLVNSPPVTVDSGCHSKDYILSHSIWVRSTVVTCGEFKNSSFTSFQVILGFLDLFLSLNYVFAVDSIFLNKFIFKFKDNPRFSRIGGNPVHSFLLV
uniref:Uncharacterized protein n=1 Tax=Cacopsylla melanoneura TaxID=428564 RepID=A0A8D8T205_9HEMI